MMCFRLFSVFISPQFSVAGSSSMSCSTEQAMVAEEEPARLTIALSKYKQSWLQDLEKSYVKFGHCDDGAIAEGYSVYITKAVAQSGSGLNKMAAYLSSRASFRKFIFKHIVATADVEDLHKISQFRESSCTKKNKGFCSELNLAAKAALRELGEIK